MLIIQPEPIESADDSWVEDLTLVPTTPPPTFSIVLNTGDCMDNNFVTSPNGVYKVWQQSDGHFVLYNTVTNKAIWATGAYGRTNGKLCMQKDGNLVNYSLSEAQGYYDNGIFVNTGTSNAVAYWSSNTTGNNNQLIIKDDGDLVIRDSFGNVKWSTNTVGK
jgi:hypothetical protein